MRTLSLLVALLSCLAFAAPAEAANTTAVVDIVRCMEAHKQTKNAENTFREALKQAQENATRTDERLKKLARELEAMNAEDPARVRKERQYQLQLATAKFNFEWDQKQAMRAYVRTLEGIYRAVCGQIAAYAREKGIDLVLLRTDPKKRLSAVDLSDFGLKTRMRVVVFAEGRTDITDPIVKILESKE